MKKTYSPALKFKVALAAWTGQPIIDICRQYEVSDGLAHKWKKELKERGADVFSQRKQTIAVSDELEVSKLYQRIGQLSTEVDFLKKVVGDWAWQHVKDLLIQLTPYQSMRAQCNLIRVCRSSLYYEPTDNTDDVKLLNLIREIWFDSYLGVVSLVRIKSGQLKKGDKILVMSTGQSYTAEQIGVFTPKREYRDMLGCGEVGFIVANVKDVHGAPVGDTLTHVKPAATEALAGFKKVKPQVYAGLFPISSDDYETFRDALGKLSLNDASLFYEPETSQALGFGFRCGFLGMLHMEIIQERLEREYNLDLITSSPTVVYEVIVSSGETVYVDNPSKLPDLGIIEEIREPICEAHILVPQEYVGNVMKLCQEKRGVQLNMNYLGKQVSLTYELPMAEVVLDFFDRLKSVSRGYASLDYGFKRYDVAKVTRLDILINGDRVDALAVMVHADQAQYRGRALVDRLKDLIPRQMFDVAIQAAMGAHIIARSSVKALRKNVLAKCYGGDISRKKKLLEKQKEGKKRMKQIGAVEIPQDAFLAILKVDK